MQVSTFLWFDGQAEAAAAQYTRIFDDSRIVAVDHAPDGRVTTVTFELGGHRCVAFDGGPQLRFTGAMSLYATCDTQEEVDRIWAGLVDGGEEGPGGSLTDRFGVTWQVIPNALGDLLDGAEPDAAERVLTALHGMTKINIQELADVGVR